MTDKESNVMLGYNEVTTSDEAIGNKPDVPDTSDIGNNSNYVAGVSDEVIYILDVDSNTSKKVFSNYSCVKQGDYIKYIIEGREVYCFSTAIAFFGTTIGIEEDEQFFSWLKQQVY